MVRNLWSLLLKLIRQTSKYRKIVYLDRQPYSGVYYKTLYAVMAEGIPKWLLLRCPCGCGEILKLPLMTNHNPHWQITNGKDGLTVFPSVNVTDNCLSHFWIRDNHVNWAE